MVIADAAVVRKLAGNRSTQILPLADIENAIAFSDSLVQTALNKFDWVEGTDPAYQVVKQASEYFAASEILGRFQDKEEESKNEWERGEYLLKTIKENFAASTGGTDEDFGTIVNIVTKAYQTHPLNPRAPYRRASGALVNNSSAEGMDNNRHSAFYW
jgi:hypothetical protein